MNEAKPNSTSYPTDGLKLRERSFPSLPRSPSFAIDHLNAPIQTGSNERMRRWRSSTLEVVKSTKTRMMKRAPNAREIPCTELHEIAQNCEKRQNSARAPSSNPKTETQAQTRTQPTPKHGTVHEPLCPMYVCMYACHGKDKYRPTYIADGEPVRTLNAYTQRSKL